MDFMAAQPSIIPHWDSNWCQAILQYYGIAAVLEDKTPPGFVRSAAVVYALFVHFSDFKPLSSTVVKE